MTAEGEATAKITGVKAEGECKKIKASQESQVGIKNAESTKIVGQAEADLK